MLSISFLALLNKLRAAYRTTISSVQNVFTSSTTAVAEQQQPEHHDVPMVRCRILRVRFIVCLSNATHSLELKNQSTSLLKKKRVQWYVAAAFLLVLLLVFLI